jgi:DNA mismatch repair protein MutS
MRFSTDQQTLEDLNIFGKHGTDSIYGLFNRTCTRGGAALLEECFRYPLADEKLINQRSSIIRYFAATGAEFPFKSEGFDQAEQYLANEDERTKLSVGERTLRDKMSSLIAEDSDYKTIQRGVAALVEILQTLQQWITGAGPDSRAGTGAGSRAGIDPYQAEREAFSALLAEQALQPLLLDDHHRSHNNRDHQRKLTFEKVAAYDSVLRFRHRDTIHRLLQRIYQLDMYISVAKVARARGFNFAEALPKERHIVRLEGVYHPQVKNAVPNTLDITPDSNLIFLTGANMAGKSTFMKSLGIALFLAHAGLPVPAAKMLFSVRDGIYTTINLPDDLGMGASHFYAEVLRVKKIARELSLSKSLFVIFDELFRGTNVKDAYEATVALTTAFAKRRDSMFVISTHIIEAGDVLKEIPNISFIYLPTRLRANLPVYTYTLEKGITADRHGMVIINNEGILDILKKGKPKLTKTAIV